MRSQAEHVLAKGYGCPFCGAENCHGEDVDTGVTDGFKRCMATQDMICPDCDQTWIDFYTLTGYWPTTENKIHAADRLGEDALVNLLGAINDMLNAKLGWSSRGMTFLDKIETALKAFPE